MNRASETHRITSSTQTYVLCLSGEERERTGLKKHLRNNGQKFSKLMKKF